MRDGEKKAIALISSLTNGMMLFWWWWWEGPLFLTVPYKEILTTILSSWKCKQTFCSDINNGFLPQLFDISTNLMFFICVVFVLSKVSNSMSSVYVANTP
jgi:hypothetical protein